MAADLTIFPRAAQDHFMRLFAVEPGWAIAVEIRIAIELHRMLLIFQYIEGRRAQWSPSGPSTIW
ncbi:MAG TPA: hypothetical protein VGH81_00690 [Rudaea sp.]|jgi:hypothetical protein